MSYEYSEIFLSFIFLPIGSSTFRVHSIESAGHKDTRVFDLIFIHSLAIPLRPEFFYFRLLFWRHAIPAE
jgi:hypothetical protein